MTGTGGWYSIAFNEAGIPDRYWRIRQTATLIRHAPRTGEMEFYGLGEPPSETAPRLTLQHADLNIPLGSTFSLKITATGSLPMTYGASGLPAGLVIDTQTGIISGMPMQVGDFAVSLVASNQYGLGTGSVTFHVPHLVAWGDNEYGQSIVPIGLSNVIAKSL